jgi:hypothetical protein
MNRFASAIGLFALFCIQLPNLGSLNHLLIAVDEHNLKLPHEIIASDGNGGYVLFFQANYTPQIIENFLINNQPDASFCPTS